MSEAVIAVAGTGTAFVNLAVAWRTASRKVETQAATLESLKELDRSLVLLESAVGRVAGNIEARVGEAHGLTNRVLDMYHDLVKQMLPRAGSE